MDRKQGLLGEFLGQRPEDPTEDPDDPAGEPASSDPGAAPSGGGRVDAYEEDWYRSLKALAARRAEPVADDEEEEEDGEEAAPEEAAPESAPERPAAAEVQPKEAPAREAPAAEKTPYKQPYEEQGTSPWAIPERDAEPQAETAPETEAPPEAAEDVPEQEGPAVEFEAHAAVEPDASTGAEPAVEAEVSAAVEPEASTAAEPPAEPEIPTAIEPEIIEGSVETRDAASEVPSSGAATPEGLATDPQLSVESFEPEAPAAEDDSVAVGSAPASDASPSDELGAEIVSAGESELPAPPEDQQDDTPSAPDADWIGLDFDAQLLSEPAELEAPLSAEATAPAVDAPEEQPHAALLPEPPSVDVDLPSELSLAQTDATPTGDAVSVAQLDIPPEVEVPDVEVRGGEVESGSIDEERDAVEGPDALDVPVLPEPSAPSSVEPAEPSLTARSPAKRRAALEEIGARGLADGELDQVGALVLDPDQDVRQAAARVLSGMADRVDDATIRQALQDPADDVRAEAVRLAAQRGARDLELLAPLVGARRWPHTQAAVLEVLPELIATISSLGEDELDPLLASVGEMESAPLPDEREMFARLGRTVGVSRLVGSLSLTDIRRLGAVRILMEGEEAPEILRALATLVTDPIDEIREVAEVAADAMARVDMEAVGRDETPDDAPLGPAEAERIASLARSLHDTDEAVRHLARSGLNGVERGRVLAWAREALHTGDPETALTAAETVGVLRLYETGVDILNRAIEVPSDDREPFLAALARLRLEDLVGLLEQVDEPRKPEAVRVLWKTSGANVLPHLRAHLDDPSVPVRMAVLEVMGEAGDANGADVARFVLETDQSPALRAAAIRVIGRTDGDASQALTRAMIDPEASVRVAALEELTPRLGREADPQLLQALTDSDEQVRRAGMNQLASREENDLDFVWSALGECRPEERSELGSVFAQSNPGALTELSLQHCGSPDQHDRILAVELAGWSKSQACVEAAIQALQDPAPAVRAAAAKSLGRLKDASAVRALGTALGDPHVEVRVEVVRALGVIDDEGVLGLLVAALQDSDPQVRTVTSEVLTQWSSPAVAKRLAGVLAVPNLRDAAVDLLRKIGPSSQELMIDVLLHSGPEVDAIVGRLLGEVVGLPVLSERLSATEATVRLRGVEAVGAVGGSEAVDALIGVLSDPDERIRARSVQLLAQLGDPRGAAAIERTVLHDPVPEIVAAAEDALARLGGAGAPPVV